MVLPYSYASKRCRLNCKRWRPWSHCSLRSSLLKVYTVCPDLSVQIFRIIAVCTFNYIIYAVAKCTFNFLNFLTICTHTPMLFHLIGCLFSGKRWCFCCEISCDASTMHRDRLLISLGISFHLIDGFWKNPGKIESKISMQLCIAFGPDYFLLPFGSRHEKTCLCLMRPTKVQISQDSIISLVSIFAIS